MSNQPQKLPDSTIRAYSDPAWLYDIRGFFILTFAYHDTLWRQIQFFNKNMGTIHAEFAVGTGTLLSIMLQIRKWQKLSFPSSIIISDYVPSMLAAAQQRFANNPRITSRVANLEQLPYPDAYFDSINIPNSLHCIRNMKKALSEVYRVLKPEGTFAANTLLDPRSSGLLDSIAKRINTWGMKKGILYKPYSVTEVHQLLEEAGFKIEESIVHGNALYTLVKRP
jgi:ubiquinone/menaquinone biosynthesis C-methylase UbiE